MHYYSNSYIALSHISVCIFICWLPILVMYTYTRVDRYVPLLKQQ